MFKELNPAQIVPLVKAPTTLLIDIRPITQAEVSRIPHAISLIVPSTLLKRPTFLLDKMAEMVDPVSRPKFEKWVSASRIIIFDADTAILSEGSNLLALLRKFHAAGYKGELSWVKGGFNAIAKGFPSIVDVTQSTVPRQDTPTQQTGNDTLLRARHISTHAFQQSSTSLVGQNDPRTGTLTQPTTGSSMAANPFYDNIRQNLELSQGVDNKIPLVLPPEVIARKNELPAKWLRDLVDQAEVDSSEDALAMQFYRIELGEQRRLQKVMEHHSRESGANAPSLPTDAVDFPYSITAGIEMGSRNRYRNIWPFEHARVRLSQSAGKGSDYVNASFVQSIVSPRRYIATQGPMDSTYDDFWS
jgi:tyrosine-protein phosphatase 2/3